jgi:hypothetical protein
MVPPGTVDSNPDAATVGLRGRNAQWREGGIRSAGWWTGEVGEQGEPRPMRLRGRVREGLDPR